MRVCCCRILCVQTTHKHTVVSVDDYNSSNASLCEYAWVNTHGNGLQRELINWSTDDLIDGGTHLIDR